MYRFIFKDTFSRYSRIERIIVDEEELNAIEVRDFFQRYGVKLKLTTTYNLEANSKSERWHLSITNVLIKICKDKSK